MARLLIVDDEEEDRLFQRTVLESAGHEIFFAKDGEEALRAFIRQGVDVVLTDLVMPNVGGLELIKVLGDFAPTPPIIAISGKGPKQLSQAKHLGAYATLTKPVDPQELLDTVDRAIAER